MLGTITPSSQHNRLQQRPILPQSWVGGNSSDNVVGSSFGQPTSTSPFLNCPPAPPAKAEAPDSEQVQQLQPQQETYSIQTVVDENSKSAVIRVTQKKVVPIVSDGSNSLNGTTSPDPLVRRAGLMSDVSVLS